jgi:hypothetical protein
MLVGIQYSGRCSTIGICQMYKFNSSRTLLFIFVTALWSVNGTRAQSTHGTVNIIIANQNGLVVVTDSRLSDTNGRRTGYAPKLFKLDSLAVCSIAGFYSDGGPLSFRGISYPISTAVPVIMRSLIENSHFESMDLETKLNHVALQMEFSLAVLLNTYAAAHRPVKTSPSEITVSGYDRGRLGYASTTLYPVILPDGRWSVRRGDVITNFVSDRAIYHVAGIRDPSLNILNGQPGEYGRDPVVGYYEETRIRDHGRTMTLLDMKQTAEVLEALSSERNPDLIGGDTQIAVFHDGSLKDFKMNVETPDYPIGSAFSIIDGLTMRGPHLPGAGVASIDSGRALVINRAEVEDARVQLDRSVYTNSVFTGCTLVYDATDFAIFDTDSNKVTNGTLELGPGVSNDDPLVKKILAAYSTIKLVHRSVKS